MFHLGRRLNFAALIVGSILFLTVTAGLAQSPEIRTEQDIYSPRAPITVLFSNVPGNKKDLIVLVPEGAPAKGPFRKFGFLNGQVSGSIRLGGLPREGRYEARLMINNSRTDIAASFPFRIGDPTAAGTHDEDNAAVGTGAEPASETSSGTTQVPEGRASSLEAASTDIESPKMQTSKLVYEQNEAIEISYEGAPGHKKDSIVILRWGEATRHNRLQYLNGAQSGRITFKGLMNGTYEALLLHGESYRSRATGASFIEDESQILARQKFTVGSNCSGLKSNDDAICELSIWTNKDSFAIDEPISVYFEGGPGNIYDWVTIARKTDGGGYKPPPGNLLTFAPDGEHKPFFNTNGKMSGSFLFSGFPLEDDEEDRGYADYEAQFYIWRASEPAARFPFRIAADAEFDLVSIRVGADPASSGTHYELPEPGLIGSWLGDLRCRATRVRRGDDRQFVPALLSITDANPMRAEIAILPRTEKAFSLRLSGSFTKESGEVTLEPSEWIYRPKNGGWPVAIRAKIDGTGLRLEGRVEGTESCTDFVAVKFERDDHSPREDGLIAAWSKYGDKLVNEATCADLLRWTMGNEVVKTQGQDVPSQVVNGNGFYAALGKSYDEWTTDDRSIFTKFHGRCLSLASSSRDIQLAELAQSAKSPAAQSLNAFLARALPVTRGTDASGARFNYIAQFDYLANYVLVVGLRYARAYAKRQLDDAKTLTNSRVNLNRITSEIDNVLSGHGILKALTEDGKSKQIAALTEIKERMSGALVDEKFAEFDFTAYSKDLDGLKLARRDERRIVDDARTYATASQLTDLMSRFTQSFAPLSESVSDQVIESMSDIEGTPQGFIAGKVEKHTIASEIIPPPPQSSLRHSRGLIEGRRRC